MAMDSGLVILQAPVAAAAVTGQVTTTTGVKFELILPAPFDVAEIGFVCTVATDADTMAITFRRRPTPGSASGQSTIGVVTGPAATIIAAGSVVRKYVGEVHCAKGDGIAIDVTDATGAGSGFMYVKGYWSGESASEVGDIASTT